MASCCWRKFSSTLLFLTLTCHCNAINATNTFNKRLVAQDMLFNSTSNISKRQNPHIPPIDFTNSFHQRIVALGDLDGDFENAKKVLQLSHVVHDNGNWAGTANVLVQVGGVVNKGPDMIELINYLESLREQAGPERVFTLFGEPELKNLIGDWTEVSTDDVKSFGSSQRRYDQIRGWIGNIWADKYIAALRLPLHPSIGPPNTSSKSHLLPNAALLFVHGGLCPDLHMQYPFPISINQVLKELIRKLQKIELQTPSSSRRKVPFNEVLMAFEHDLLSSDGPLSYSGWAPNKPVDCAHVEKVLEQTGTRRVIVGHTSVIRIQQRCDGKIILINTGISRLSGNHLSALIIEYTTTPVFEDGKIVKLIEKEVIEAAYIYNKKEELVFRVETIPMSK